VTARTAGPSGPVDERRDNDEGETVRLGILGGSGVYGLEGLESVERRVTTPFGEPSAPIREVKTAAGTLWFLPRHGVGHTFLPSEVNYRANVFALKQLGATALVSISAVGSLREDVGPGEFVLPDQYVDRTAGVRPRTFYGNGVVGHAVFAEPTCRSLRQSVEGLLEAAQVTFHRGGCYVAVEGPQFSTRAESEWYRSLGEGRYRPSVIGMTALPEARLAREAGLCYQTVAMVTDYDCWNEREESVSVESVLAVLKANAARSQALIGALASRGVAACRNGCAALSKAAVVTAPDRWPDAFRPVAEVLFRGA
jgi:5'-methylthioadenosine phosphorylase